MSTQSNSFVYTPTSSGTYTWRFRRVHSGANAPASSYTLDTLKVSYVIPYTRTECQETDLAYRFGFNRKEDDRETSTQDYGFRIYNPQIGKFLSVDPLKKKYPELSPYQFASNTPISAIDLDGGEALVVTIRPTSGSNDPALKQVHISKLISAVDQPTLTVRYDIMDGNNNIISSTPGFAFIPGSVEALMANSVDLNGVNNISKLRASQGQNQDPAALATGRNEFTGLNGFEYSFNIRFKTNKARINSTDLSTETPLLMVQTQISNAQTTLNSSVQYTGMNGQTAPTDLRNYNLTVVGQTDGQSSDYNRGCGNPCLSQDRATNLVNALGSMNGRTINTLTINNSGGENQSNRSAKILITPVGQRQPPASNVPAGR